MAMSICLFCTTNEQETRRLTDNQLTDGILPAAKAAIQAMLVRGSRTGTTNWA